MVVVPIPLVIILVGSITPMGVHPAILAVRLRVLITMVGTRVTTSEAKDEAGHISLVPGLIIIPQIPVLEFLVLQDHFSLIVPIIPLTYQLVKYATKKGMLQLTVFSAIVHQSPLLILRFNAKFAGSLVIPLFNAIIEGILLIKEGHQPHISLPCMFSTIHLLLTINSGLQTQEQHLI
ncbi:hypothetical protein PS1_028912 [Malus domestica]